MRLRLRRILASLGPKASVDSVQLAGLRPLQLARPATFRNELRGRPPFRRRGPGHVIPDPSVSELFVEAPGIEPAKRQTPDMVEQQCGSIGVHGDRADVPDRASKCSIDRRDVTESSADYELSNVVERALAKALVLAAESNRWEVVLQIAEELGRRGSEHRSARSRAQELPDPGVFRLRKR